MPHLKRLLTPAPALLLAACGSVFGIEQSELGYISASATDPPSLSAPDTVGAHHPFVVTVTTGGPSGCWTGYRTRVVQDSQRVTITPYDRVVGGVCTQAPVRITHSTTISFPTPGTATIVAHGRARNRSGAEIDIQKTVVVVPSITP
ncbi:MAG TPA: hypothetical protein VFH27_09525 [Longimicrobiaceae bacterium]|nr:hypothetical protein [Longimicrobiaceae bacterium]